MTLQPPIWTLLPEAVYQASETTEDGLSDQEAAVRLEHYEYNELPESAR